MKVLTLNKPIKLGENKQLTELKFKEEATAADCLAFDLPGQNAQVISLISSLTNTDESIVKRLSVRDFRAADKIVSELMYPELAEATPAEAAAIVEKKDETS